MDDRKIIKNLTFVVVLLSIMLIMSLIITMNFDNQNEQTQTVVINSNISINPIDINSCTKHEFMSLKGIGATKAEKFIKVRESIGAYKSVYDLIEYGVIGEESLNENKIHMKVGEKQ